MDVTIVVSLSKIDGKAIDSALVSEALVEVIEGADTIEVEDEDNTAVYDITGVEISAIDD